MDQIHTLFHMIQSNVTILCMISRAYVTIHYQTCDYTNMYIILSYLYDYQQGDNYVYGYINTAIIPYFKNYFTIRHDRVLLHNYNTTVHVSRNHRGLHTVHNLGMLTLILTMIFTSCNHPVFTI